MHVEKYTRTQMGHLLAHIERRKDENGKYVNFSNLSIDLARTPQNYSMENYGNFAYKNFQKIIGRDDVKMQKRSDVKTMVSVVLTMPENLQPNDEKQFFQIAYNFLKNRYAKHDNMICAYVHKDEGNKANEYRPHMHFAFCPLAVDKKQSQKRGKQMFKVSAKEVITMQDLKTLHTDMQDTMDKELGYKVSIRKHTEEQERAEAVSMPEFKKRMATIDTLLDEKTKTLKTQVEERHKKQKHIHNVLLSKQKELKDRESKLEKGETALRDSRIRFETEYTNFYTKHSQPKQSGSVEELKTDNKILANMVQRLLNSIYKKHPQWFLKIFNSMSHDKEYQKVKDQIPLTNYEKDEINKDFNKKIEQLKNEYNRDDEDEPEL